MYGAILGDIIGSPFEFDRGDKTKTFDLFTRGCGFTDDSVMTAAVAEALLSVRRDAAADEIRAALIGSMRRWGKRYPNAGYGVRFIGWLRAEQPEPYNSCGNGSAMRVSPAGWLYDTMERTREVAALTADVTHNHPEGIKGAEATAAAIYLARHGASKQEIREYIVSEFDYDLSRTCDEIRPDYYHIEISQKTVPEAITAFLESTDFEDAVRTVVSLGGDTDTLGAITGSIAEAFYGVPEELKKECRSRIPADILQVLDTFRAAVQTAAAKEKTMETFAFDPFKKIGEDWALVSAGNAEKSNMMTVSWGGVGVLWGKNVVYIFIRESRYTKEFIDAGDTFSLAFLPEKYKKNLGFCGSQTGRGIDKWQAAGLTPAEQDGVVYPAEADTAFLCRKLAAIPVAESGFIDPSIMPDWYTDHDMHTMYVGEVIGILR